MDGKYEIGRDHIRALAIECHALDVQFDRLFNAPTICGASDRVYRAYNRLLSTKLLNLAISIRVDLANQPGYKSTEVQPAAIFLQGGPTSGHGFSMKDICDKIIHAERIYKPIEPGVQRAGCELSGRQHDREWVLGLGVQIFCEYVLRWLEELEDQVPEVQPAG